MSNTKITLDDVIKFIASASKDERSRLSEVLSYRFAREVESAMVTFNFGDRVSFRPSKRGYYQDVEGKIVKIARKTITICTDNGVTWRVTPTLLKKV